MLVIESSPEPLAAPVQSPAKKRKVDKKPKKKVLAKRKKTSKATTSETDVEPRGFKQGDEHVEVEMPPRASLLQNKRLNVGIMHQLLSNVDTDTINECRIQSHLNELLWDGLKVSLLNLRIQNLKTNYCLERL